MLKLLFSMGFFIVTVFVPQVDAGQVNAFLYHRFDETRYPSTNISSEVFTQQLEYLKNQKLKVVSLDEVAARLVNGEDLPDHAAALCVDDSYRSFYDVAMPIVRQYGFPVTLFVNTDAVGMSGYLTWDELKELAAEGVKIGNHTAAHAYLVELKPGETHQQWKERIRQDILKAQQQFEKYLGFKPTLFTYPFGEYSAEVIEIVQDLGFIAAFAQQSGVIYENYHRYILPRFPMGGPFATLKGFKNKLAMQPLIVITEYPFDPVMQQNPPVLSLQISGKQIATQRFNCFVQGENRCWVKADKDKGVGWYRVVAEQPLTGRRNKYTLTVQSKQGDWLWYSHPWVNAKNPAIIQK